MSCLSVWNVKMKVAYIYSFASIIICSQSINDYLKFCRSLKLCRHEENTKYNIWLFIDLHSLFHYCICLDSYQVPAVSLFRVWFPFCTAGNYRVDNVNSYLPLNPICFNKDEERLTWLLTSKNTCVIWWLAIGCAILIKSSTFICICKGRAF